MELTLRDGTKLTKYPRDFLTGAVVEQALADAIDQLIFFAEQSRREDVGLEGWRVSQSLRRQIETLADNVTAYNASDYVDLPEHSHVANVRRLRGTDGRLNHLVSS